MVLLTWNRCARRRKAHIPRAQQRRPPLAVRFRQAACGGSMAKKEAQGSKRGRDAGTAAGKRASGGKGSAKARRTGDATPGVAALARQCYARVASFAFDDPAAAAPVVTFLARYSSDFEVGAPATAAAHAEQYLRFMALKAALLLAAEQAPAAAAPSGDASAAATGVTPPLAVDAVWHTHLLYSRSYARLCAALLGRDAVAAPPGTAFLIPHEPSPGGDAAAALFAAQYAAAAALYLEAFGVVPPAEVWTPAAHRFAPAQQVCCITRGERAALRVMKASLEERMHAVSAGEEDDSDFGGCG